MQLGLAINLDLSEKWKDHYQCFSLMIAILIVRHLRCEEKENVDDVILEKRKMSNLEQSTYVLN